MNRLVLIGNGFDLAHGLRTKYEHFLIWYWEQRMHNIINNKSKVSYDGLCKLTTLKDVSWCSSVFSDMTLKHGNGVDIISHLIEDKENYNVELYYLFERIHKSVGSKGWVDIENDYYSLLARYISPVNAYSDKDICEINSQLTILRNLLIRYLENEEKKDVALFEGIRDNIYMPIIKRDISIANNKYANGNLHEEILPSKIMLLNFNYTKTPELYMKGRSDVEINYIHGKLENPDSVIFGYGDELDSDFEKLKEKNNNECLRHVKSIKYLESDNYRRVLDFIESAPFQVCIMGHSCGISDRTLLNTIFEHKFCASIKPYFFINDKGEDNYLDLVMNISRNFKDMKLMRDRVVNKTYCEPLTRL